MNMDAEKFYQRCTYLLREQKQSYPRTCEECGLGPCKVPRFSPPAKVSPPPPSSLAKQPLTADDVRRIVREELSKLNATGEVK